MFGHQVVYVYKIPLDSVRVFFLFTLCYIYMRKDLGQRGHVRQKGEEGERYPSMIARHLVPKEDISGFTTATLYPTCHVVFAVSLASKLLVSSKLHVKAGP